LLEYASTLPLSGFQDEELDYEKIIGKICEIKEA
jgi:hypothetical protein